MSHVSHMSPLSLVSHVSHSTRIDANNIRFGLTIIAKGFW